MSSQNGNGQQSATAAPTGTMHELAPCSCCMALAHVRLPHGAINPPTDAAAVATSPAAQTCSAPAKKRRSLFSFMNPGNVFSINRGYSKPVAAAAENPDENTGSTSSANTTAPHDEWDEALMGPRPRKLWQGLDGAAVVLFGIVVPLLTFMLSCISMPKRITLVMLNHPLETLAELSLMALLPVINYVVWAGLCKHKVKHPKLAAIAVGCNVGTALVVSLVSLAMMFAPTSTYQDGVIGPALAWLAIFSLGSAVIGGYIIHALRASRVLSNNRQQVLLCSSLGLISAMAIFGLSESRPWMVRLAEETALSTNKTEARRGMDLLRQLNPERELHMQCADSRATGLAGMFLPIKAANEQQLYFALSGKPYSFHQTDNIDLSAMPDDYLSRNIVGDPIPGLTLTRSRVDAVVHPRTMSSSLSWTFVFKNDTQSPQEVRAEIAMPPGAVVAGLSAWQKGEQMEASFVAAQKTSVVSQWTQIGHDSPATIRDVGRGRLLMHCYPVPQDQEYRVRISMALPLRPDGTQKANMLMPRLVAANFDLSGEHDLNVKSDERLSSTLQSVSNSRSADGWLLSGAITADQMKSAATQIDVERSAPQAIAVYDGRSTQRAHLVAVEKENERVRKENEKIQSEQEDVPEHQVVLMLDGSKSIGSQLTAMNRAFTDKTPHKKKLLTPKRIPIVPHFVVETVERVAAAAPKHLVVVIDGSESTKPYVDKISSALAQLPSGIAADVIFASQEGKEFAKPMPLAKAVGMIDKVAFVGGQDNLKSVVDAAELAGDSKSGAVLWIHGPQPALNQEIYLMSAYVGTPKFYELTLGTEQIDTLELFRNHPEIGPFSQVPRYSDNIGEDLKTFLSRWKPGDSTYSVKLVDTTKLPEHFPQLDSREQIEVLALHAKQQCDQLLSRNRRSAATEIAVGYGFISQTSCAFISPNALNQQGESTAAPLSGPIGDAFATSDTAGSAPAASSTTAESVGGGGGAADGFASADCAGSGNVGISDRAGEFNALSQPSNNTGLMLQGATNGTLGPQGTDATVISGVTTAGTVRVNNLANVEVLFNIIANLSEVVLLVVGLVMVALGISGKGAMCEIMGQEIEITPGERITIGALLAIIGLALPCMINWFLAAARDANLFS
ncbi:MAG TPA: hypothetical protein V6D22_06925 [Candidatus Obscuribacterales bacterium]